MYFTADLLNFSFNAQPFDSKDCLFSSSWRYIESVRTKQYSRSSHRRYSMKKSVLRNFLKCTGKHLWQSLFFNKVAHLRPATSLKKRLWHRCFPVKFAKLLRTPLFYRAPLDDCSWYSQCVHSLLHFGSHHHVVLNILHFRQYLLLLLSQVQIDIALKIWIYRLIPLKCHFQYRTSYIEIFIGQFFWVRHFIHSYIAVQFNIDISLLCWFDLKWFCNLRVASCELRF